MSEADSGTPKPVSEPVGVLVPGRNGGKIWRGKAPNHVAGPGRPADALRHQLRELGLKKGVKVLESVMDGVLDVSLVGTCVKCKHEQPLDMKWFEAVQERISASTDQRLKASDIAMKYGLAAKELVITSASSAAFFDCVYQAIVEQHGEDAAEAIKARAADLIKQSA